MQRLGEVGSVLPPSVDPEERRLAVTPGAALQHALGHGHSEVGYRSAVVGEAQLWVVNQVADNDGLVVAGHQALPYTDVYRCLDGRAATAQGTGGTSRCTAAAPSLYGYGDPRLASRGASCHGPRLVGVDRRRHPP